MTKGEYMLTLECDQAGCDAWEIVYADNRMNAKTLAREKGWMIRLRGNKCMCKHHADALRANSYRLPNA